MKIVGYRRYDFTTETGHYSGYKIWTTDDGHGDVVGCVTDTFSVSDRVCTSSSFVPEVGMEIEVSYRKESRHPARIFVL